MKGASPTRAGLLILPLVLGLMIASIVSGQLTARTGRYKIFPVIGSAMMVGGLLLLNTINADTALLRSRHLHVRLRPRARHAACRRW